VVFECSAVVISLPIEKGEKFPIDLKNPQYVKLAKIIFIIRSEDTITIVYKKILMEVKCHLFLR